MITAYDGAMLWCAVQALIVAGCGLVATWIFSRRAPAAAASAAMAAVATIIAVTLLVPARMPKLELGQSKNGAVRESAEPATHSPEASAGATDARAAFDGYAARVKAALARYAALAQGAATEEAATISTRTIVAALLAASAVAGLAQFAYAWATIARLRQRRRPIVNASLQRHFAELRAVLKVRRPVELCESAAIASPALIGWRHPAVLLPVDRAGWTDEQLRATLAHELAHVARGDFLWRAVARLAVAIHFYQPAIHWLARRFALLQEVGADQLAAQAVGGTAAYVRSLSQLAIRLDDHARRRSASLVLPALSSNLTRRITMLRSKEGSDAFHRRGAGGLVAAALIALVGASTMALRGAAESADVTPTANAAKSFDAEPLDLSFLGPIKEGRIVIRPHRMTQRSVLAPLVEFIQTAIDASAASEHPQSTWRPRLDTVEYYAIQVHFNVDVRDPTAVAQHRGAAMTGDVAIRFTDEPAARDFWEQTNKTPKAELINAKGFTYVRVSVEPMGDQVPAEHIGAMYVAKRDARTFIISDNLERLKHMIEHADEPSTDEAAAAWASLDGGLITAYGDAQSTEFGMMFLASVLSDNGIEVGEVLLLLRNNMQSFGYGVDLDPVTNEIELHAKARCNDAAGAKQVCASFAKLQGFANVQLAGISQGLNDPAEVGELTVEDRATIDAHGCWTRLLADAKVETQPSAGQAVEVRIDASAPFPRQFTAYLLRPEIPLYKKQ